MKNDLGIYDRVADRWWEDRPPWLTTLSNLVPARLGWFDAVAPGWEGARVLDLGCAGGYMAEALARQGARVTGLDPAGDALASARRHAAREGLDITYQQGVGERLPFEDGCFDRVVCVDVLEHVASPAEVLAEVARVLKPGGLLLFDTLNRTLFARVVLVWAAEALGLVPRGVHDADRFLRIDELRGLLTEAGLETLDLTGLGPSWIDRRGVVSFRPMRWTMGMYMGVARKAGGAVG